MCVCVCVFFTPLPSYFSVCISAQISFLKYLFISSSFLDFKDSGHPFFHFLVHSVFLVPNCHSFCFVSWLLVLNFRRLPLVFPTPPHSFLFINNFVPLTWKFIFRIHCF